MQSHQYTNNSLNTFQPYVFCVDNFVDSLEVYLEGLSSQSLGCITDKPQQPTTTNADKINANN